MSKYTFKRVNPYAYNVFHWESDKFNQCGTHVGVFVQDSTEFEWEFFHSWGYISREYSPIFKSKNNDEYNRMRRVFLDWVEIEEARELEEQRAEFEAERAREIAIREATAN